jgi:lipooligosaccharide transport system permease protein
MAMSVGSGVKMNWVGAKTIVDPQKSIQRGSLYVAESRIKNMLRWWKSIVAFGLGNPTLYLLSVGIGIGTLVDNSLGGNGIDGVNYLTFLAPALLATAGIQGAMEEVTWPTLQGFTWDKTFFSMNATAITGRQIANGILLAALARCVIQVFLYSICLLAFGAITWQSIPILLLVSCTAGIGFGAIMLGFAASIKDDDGVFALVGRFIVTPMFMFSGTFYPITSLPIYLQWIGWISPQWHATNLGRAMSYGMPIETWLLVLHWAVMILMSIVGLIWARRVFERRLSE